MTNFGLHMNSFQETYTERALNVTRTQLNETGLDPEVYLNLPDFSIDQKKDEETIPNFNDIF